MSIDLRGRVAVGPEPDAHQPPATPAGDGLAAVARGGLANLAGAGFAGLAGFGVAWLVARSLGPATAGVLFAAVATFTLGVGVARLGTPTGLVFWIARLRGQGRPELTGAALWTGAVPVAAAAVLLAVALWLAAPWLAGLTAGGPATADPAGTVPDATGTVPDATGAVPAATSILRTLAWFLPAAALTEALLAATRGHHRMRPTVVLDKLLRPALQLSGIAALAVAALWTTVPPAGWPVAWAGPYLPVLLLAGYATWAVRPELARPPAGTAVRAVARPFWRFTGPRAVASVLQQAMQRLDILLVAALAGPAAAAVYTVAGRFLILGQFANQAVGHAIQPRLAERLGAGDRAGAGVLYQTATGWLVLVSWPLYLLVGGFASSYLGLFGEAYRSAAAVVVVLALAMLLATACGVVDMLLAMAGRTSWNLCNVCLALAVMVALDLVLVPRHGAVGAAVGLAAAVAVNNLLPLAQVGYALRVHPFGAGTLTAAGLATGCFGVLPALVTTVAGTGPVALGGSVAAAAGAYAIGARLLRRPLALTTLTTIVANRSRRRDRPHLNRQGGQYAQ